MILNNLRLVQNDAAVSIRVADGRVARVSDAPLADKSCTQVVFVNAIAFPGLINSHDHLDFNLFPRLGNKTYKSYTEWGKYIHEQYETEIAEGLKIPAALREKWGIFKNLLCGVTTVVNHDEKNPPAHDLITVHEQTQDLHSVQFDAQWKKRLNNPLKYQLPVVMHVGEGTDAASKQEIDQLTNWNLMNRKLIGVHGVAMTASQAQKFEALVWCPQSNYFLLNATAPVKHLKKFTQILFGTDSTLTSDWSIWEHIRLARETHMLTDEELFASLTSTPAKVWQLNAGSIAEGLDANIVIAKAKAGNAAMESFYQTQPDDILMVMHKGEVVLFDQSLYHQLNEIPLHKFGKIHSGNSIKYVQGNLQRLMSEIRKYQSDIQFPVYVPSEPAA